ncbi:unnamed protein product [Gongylonema pulchrum]|uniref:Zn-ribbon_14 domain-containing protein n=1 Tax=Gongylonema pulchrum TaxID=637853 RepID=A0A183ESY3_9BILA|nr:unnamed protein product [Gongylonema pulchrum]
MPRVKPLKYTFEKDIVLYAHFNKLRYFSTECRYARDSFRSYIRTYVKELERIRPKAILDLIRSGESICVRTNVSLPVLSACERCGYMSSQKICKACLLLQGLNTNNHKLGVNSRQERFLVEFILSRRRSRGYVEITFGYRAVTWPSCGYHAASFVDNYIHVNILE